ncbi:MAG: SusD/RagB family nutrient-binding outer membrane lipoprotein [Flavobacteriaceae bacterium]
MKNKFFSTNWTLSVLAMLLAVTYSCETTDLDVNENPNALTVDSADPNFVLNQIQLTFAAQHLGLSGVGRAYTRQGYMFGTYAANAGAGTMNGPWSNAYSITTNLNLLKEISAARNLPNHVGIGQVLEAFAYVNLVDFIGTAVYSEAVNPDFPAPNLDSGQSIYDAMFLQLDEAIANLNATGSVQPEDIFYNGDMSKWVKMANTLKIKMYVSSKLSGANASAVNTIVTSGNFIAATADDFQFRYGTSETNPDTRHPFFTSDYLTVADSYMSNSFMYMMKWDAPLDDPRLKYYFYRQTLLDPLTVGENLGIGGDLLPCDGASEYDYCYIGDGYWGRDHGDDEGIPNDGIYRTAYGVYPGGGAYDDGTTNGLTTATSNMGGAGIHPMLTGTYTHFMLAEAALPAPAGLGAAGNSRALLEAGIRMSMAKVAGFAGVPMSPTAVNNYVNTVLDMYDDAADNQAKLAIIMKEYHIALFGNGVEPYNNYRRTGYPDLQGSVIAGTAFPRSLFLPSSELNSNDNPDLVQKSLTDQVFWDTNPAGFID